MELLLVIILILTFYGISKLFSYFKNKEVSYPKINPTEFFNKKRLELQEIIDNKKEQKRNKIKVIEKREDPSNITPINYIENQPWRQFEREVATMFSDRGFEVVLGPGKEDNGKDIVIRRGSEIYIIQCKHYFGRKMVSANEIRDFQGAIDLYEKQNNMTVKGIFITSGKTSFRARETARILSIQLWDKYKWKDKINNL